MHKGSIIIDFVISLHSWASQWVNHGWDIFEEGTAGIGEVIILNNLPFTSTNSSVHSKSSFFFWSSLTSVADISIAWNIFLKFAIGIEDRFSLNNLVHAVNAIIILLKP